MKRNLVKRILKSSLFSLLAMGFASCQRNNLDVGLKNFQAASEAQLLKLSGNYSRSFAIADGRQSRAAYSANGYQYIIPGVGVPQGMSTSQYTYSTPYNLQVPQVQFQSSLEVAAQNCKAIQDNIPKSAETYAFAMVTLARCLNRMIHERNTMLTWMYQQGSNFGQSLYGYSMNYGSMVPYPQYTYSNYMPLNNFAYNGWAN